MSLFAEQLLFVRETLLYYGRGTMVQNFSPWCKKRTLVCERAVRPLSRQRVLNMCTELHESNGSNPEERNLPAAHYAIANDNHTPCQVPGIVQPY